jgi:2-polyprenyl-6-methoxyphenol hydroxylase-like FAD-dependent oxidoreductase
MRAAIAIVGGGQSGLQLAIALKRKNFSVTLFTNKTAEQILSGKILSSQAMFSSALSIERSLGIDFWQNKAPQNDGFSFMLTEPTTSKITIQCRSKIPPYQSVDESLRKRRWNSRR